MSAKLLSSLTDENKNLKKQIGCMNRIFQLFGNAHFLSRRGMGSNNHMRLLPGQNANHKMELNSGTPKAKDKNRKDLQKEKERVSVESSRTSFSSSSCSSTFSSVDCNRTAKPEPPSTSNSNFHESPSEILTMKQKSSWRLGQQSTDLRDVVKDSIYREARGLSIKTSSKEERLGHTVKHIDSPRPMQLCESVKSKVSGVDGSSRALDSSSWTLPRYSFDGRNSRYTLKSNTKLKELPRLSLDSRARTIRSSASESRANYLLGDPHLRNGNSNQILNTRQEPASNKRPSSSVVAKLMGLEAFPDSVPTTQIQEIKSFPDEDFDSLTRPSRVADESKQRHIFGSPRNFQRDLDSPRLRNSNSVMKPTSSFRFPLEPAPPPEESLGSKKPAFVICEAPTKAIDPSPYVYGEIEKRLRELEFKKSGKDLRALKQRLEAMQKTRGRLEGSKEEWALNFEVQTGNYNSLDQSSKFTTHLRQQSNHPISPTIKGTSPPKRPESPIQTIKPAKFIEKPRNTHYSATPIDSTSYPRSLRTDDSEAHITDLNDKRTAKERNTHLKDPSSWSTNSMNKNTGARTVRSKPILKALDMAREYPTSSTRSSGTVSPRLQQKKHGMERQSHLSTPSSNPNRDRRRSSKQSTESRSPTRKLKPKSPIFQQGEDQLSETSSELRTWSYQGDAISVQWESNISLSSKIESEVTSSSCYNDISSIYQKNKNLAASLSEDNSIAELAKATMEQPSPVSVLDATFYIEDLPSPVKKISHAFQDDETLNPDKAEWNLVDIDNLLSNTISNSSSVFEHKEQENTMHLVHKLRQPNSSHDEATVDYLASLHDNTNQDHRYIAEIMLASRLLKRQGSSSSTTMQLYPSGHLINPNLFFVLEQTKISTGLQDDVHSSEIITQKKPSEKIRRKLVFDTVNEILVRKSASAGSLGIWTSPNKLGGKNPSEKQLLKELCSEMDRLQPNKGSRLDDEEDGLISILSEEMTSQSENWVDHHGEVPGVVLDIDRLIFKDLIDEVVSCESAGLKGRPRRQLFPK